MSGRSPAPAALAIVGAALVFKLALLALLLFARPSALRYIDTGTYLRPARALLATGSFSPDPASAPAPEINRTPGYPLLVAAAWGVFGERTWVAPLAGALLAAGTAVVVARLAGSLFGAGAGVVAAACLAFEPGSFLRSLEILSDTTFTFALALFVSSLVAFACEARARDAFSAGLWLALATLVRPLSYYLIPFAALFVGAVALRSVQGNRRSIGAALRFAALFLVPVLVLVGGWEARNLGRAGAFTLSPIGSSELFFYRAVPVAARAQGVPVPEMQERLGNRERFFRSGGGTEREIFGSARYRDLFPRTSGLDLVALNREWRRDALAIFGAHPFGTVAMAAKGLALLIFTPSSLILSVQYGLFTPALALTSLYEDQQVPAFALALFHDAPALFAISGGLVLLLAAIWALAAWGLRLAWREIPSAAHLALLGTFAYVAFVSAGFESSDDRYRLPLMPIASIYAARALSGARAQTGSAVRT